MEYAFLLQSNQQIAMYGGPAIGFDFSIFEDKDDWRYASISLRLDINDENYSSYYYSSSSQVAMVHFNQFKDLNNKTFDWRNVDWTVQHKVHVTVNYIDTFGNLTDFYSFDLTTAVKSKSKTVITYPVDDVQLDMNDNSSYIQQVKVAVVPGCYTLADEDIVAPYFIVGLKSDTPLLNASISYDNTNWVKPLSKDSARSYILTDFSNILGDVSFDNPYKFYEFSSTLYVKFTPSNIQRDYTIFTSETSQLKLRLKWNNELILPQVKTLNSLKQVVDCYVVKDRTLKFITDIIKV